jgi:hypothetical protein
VLTSDHGELFERGVRGHSTPILYEPLIRVPLVIFEPGRRTRTDVHSLTSAIDLLPTLLHVTAHDPAPWAEGVVLPPFAEPPARRTIHAVHTRRNKPAKPLQHATVALVNDDKLLYFFDTSLDKALSVELMTKRLIDELHDCFRSEAMSHMSCLQREGHAGRSERSIYVTCILMRRAGRRFACIIPRR